MAPSTSERLQHILIVRNVTEPLPTIPGLDVNHNPVNIFISYLAHGLVEACSCEPEVALAAIQWPNEAGMGDLVVVLPRLRLQEDVREAAIAHFIEGTASLLPLFGRPLRDGIHLRIFLNTETLGRLILPYTIAQNMSSRARTAPKSGNRASEVRPRGEVIVEFSSPNLGKEFDGNHLRSTILGSFIASLHTYLGFDVHRLNFLGDWGKHIGILAEGWRVYGSEADLEARPLPHLLECFTNASELVAAEQSSSKTSKDKESLKHRFSQSNHDARRTTAESPHTSPDGQETEGAKPLLSHSVIRVEGNSPQQGPHGGKRGANGMQIETIEPVSNADTAGKDSCAISASDSGIESPDGTDVDTSGDSVSPAIEKSLDRSNDTHLISNETSCSLDTKTSRPGHTIEIGPEEVVQHLNGDNIQHSAEARHKDDPADEQTLDAPVNIPELSSTLENKKSPASSVNVKGATHTAISDAKDVFFKELELGDTNALKLWSHLRSICVARYADLYETMHVQFDDYSGESDVDPTTIREIEEALIKKGAYVESDDALVVDFRALGLKHLRTTILRYRNGTTSYLLRDVAAAIQRSRKYSFDKMYYVVTSRQETHFKQVFEILKLIDMPELAAKLQHVSFGKVTGLVPQDGRAGLLLEDIQSQCEDVVRTLIDADPESAVGLNVRDAGQLGAAALACQELGSGKRNNTFAFDAVTLGSTGGWTGLSLYKSLAQLTQATAGMTVDANVLTKPETSYQVLSDPAFHEALCLLMEFPHAVDVVSKTLEPTPFLMLLYRLSDAVQDLLIEDLAAEGQPASDRTVKVALFEGLRLVLTAGLQILGLHLPEP